MELKNIEADCDVDCHIHGVHNRRSRVCIHSNVRCRSRCGLCSRCVWRILQVRLRLLQTGICRKPVFLCTESLRRVTSKQTCVLLNTAYLHGKHPSLNIEQTTLSKSFLTFIRSHTRTVVRECCKGRRRKSMGKREIRPIATPKPLNRSSRKVAHLIMSWIATDVQNLVTIPQGVSFPRMREIAHQNVYSAFLGSSNDLQPRRLNRFSRLIRQTTRFRARMLEDKKFNIYTP